MSSVVSVVSDPQVVLADWVHQYYVRQYGLFRVCQYGLTHDLGVSEVGGDGATDAV